MEALTFKSLCNKAPQALPDQFALRKTAVFLFLIVIRITSQQSWGDILTVNQHPNKDNIHAFLKQIWNEVRGYSASSEAESDANKRKELMANQAKENSRIASRLLTTHTNILITKISYFISITGNTEQLEVNEIEKAIVKLKSKLINEFQQLNQEKLFCIQWRIQKTLYGHYYLNILVYHDGQSQLQLPQDQNLLSHAFDDEQQIIKLDLSNVLTQNIKIERDNFHGTNLAEWKVIFNSMLYPVKYYYYQSKVISAKFEYIVY